MAEIDKTLLLHYSAVLDIHQKLRPLLEPPPSPPRPEIGFHAKQDCVPCRKLVCDHQGENLAISGPGREGNLAHRSW
jgi:hypothetical protein